VIDTMSVKVKNRASLLFAFVSGKSPKPNEIMKRALDGRNALTKLLRWITSERRLAISWQRSRILSRHVLSSSHFASRYARSAKNRRIADELASPQVR
jgi:hypothetical protein